MYHCWIKARQNLADVRTPKMSEECVVQLSFLCFCYSGGLHFNVMLQLNKWDWRFRILKEELDLWHTEIAPFHFLLARLLTRNPLQTCSQNNVLVSSGILSLSGQSQECWASRNPVEEVLFYHCEEWKCCLVSDLFWKAVKACALSLLLEKRK